MPRIVIIETIAQWTAAVEEQIPLSVPDELDLKAAEAAWFEAGGGDCNSFVEYLMKLGCEKTAVEFHTISYQ